MSEIRRNTITDSNFLPCTDQHIFRFESKHCCHWGISLLESCSSSAGCYMWNADDCGWVYRMCAIDTV